MSAACSDLNKLSHIIQAKRNRTQDIHKLHVGNKVYEGQKVPDGMFESISSLKKLDTEALSSSESFVSASQTYKHILEICRAGPKIPKLTVKKAEKILKSMRPSVNDYFSITASHYLNSGESGLEHFCSLINTIIEDTNNLTIDELNIVWACILYKGHGKNKFSDRSYRTISTCPFLCKAIDSYISDLYSPTWSQQTAETQFQQKASSHDLAALTLTETITHSVKSLSRPVYVIYLDARSAFDLALKEFIINNLYEYGVNDQALLLVDQRLKNRRTVCEWNKILMGPIKDECGVEQGGINSSDLYKVYNNEQLSLAQDSQFGVPLGPVIISALGQADDVVLLANSLHALQGLFDLSLYTIVRSTMSL